MRLKNPFLFPKSNSNILILRYFSTSIDEMDVTVLGGQSVDPISAEALARIWAYAVPLTKFIEEQAGKSLREATPKTKTPRVRKLSTMVMIAGAMEFDTRMKSARDIVRAQTYNDLIAGLLVGLGRPSDAYNIERVDESFWIGSKVDWISDSVSRDGRRVIDVRIVPREAIPVVQADPHTGPGRPSKAKVICQAIDAYAKSDPRLGQAPLVRYRAYRTYISQRGYDPRRETGFSIKTFEKYEREYRNKNKQLFPN
jgi:hypothetical protein